MSGLRNLQTSGFIFLFLIVGLSVISQNALATDCPYYDRHVVYCEIVNSHEFERYWSWNDSDCDRCLNPVFGYSDIYCDTKTGQSYAGAQGAYNAVCPAGKRNGLHELVYPAGERYKGVFRNGKKHGEGTMVWPNGDIYVGNWVNDNRTGHGTYAYNNGRKYVGGWLNGKRSGNGSMTFAGGNVFTGVFENDSRLGQGTFYWLDGRKYSGSWRGSRLPGPGIAVDIDGQKCHGNWHEGKIAQGTELENSGGRACRTRIGTKE